MYRENQPRSQGFLLPVPTEGKNTVFFGVGKKIRCSAYVSRPRSSANVCFFPLFLFFVFYHLMLRIFNNKGIKLTAKTVDEDIEKAGVASRNIVMKKQYTLF